MLKPIILTMWDQFVTNESAAIAEKINARPVIMAIRLKVVSHNGLSLSTRSSSSFIIDPRIPQATTLKTWAAEMEMQLNDIITEKQYLTASSSSLAPIIENITEIALIATLVQTRSNFWINATICITKLDQHFWYMACNKCHKATGVDFNEEFSCLYCKEKAVANPRCRIEVKLDDTTGHIMATLFGDMAEKFLSCSAIKLMKETTEDGIKNIESFVKLPSDKNFLIQRAETLGIAEFPILGCIRNSRVWVKDTIISSSFA